MARDRRHQWLAAGNVLAAAAAVSACRAESPIPQENALIAVNVASKPAEQPRLEPAPPLSRSDLLLAAVQARSAATIGADDRENQKPLNNRRFQFRIRLGCTIASPGAPHPAEAVYDAERRRVSLSTAPGVSIDDPLVAALAGDRFEAAEGFWVAKPWLLEPSCAGTAADGGETALVQFFSAEQPRTARRDGRPYEARALLPDGAEAPTAGRWDLILRGRLREHNDGRVIVCRAQAEGAVPVCLISVEFERVSIEDVESGEELAQWGRG